MLRLLSLSDSMRRYLMELNLDSDEIVLILTMAAQLDTEMDRHRRKGFGPNCAVELAIALVRSGYIHPDLHLK